MQKHKPIIIAGFGRSGTTWLSDIISKALGGLILFEPYHPCVFDAAIDHTYATDSDMGVLSAQWQMSLQEIRHRWLLRNHLRSPIEDISQHYIDDIWDHCEIIGFKTIRLNHQVHKLTKRLDANLLFIIRHPLAVIGSLIGRTRFWEEFGWSWHWDTFVSRTSEIFKDPSIVKALLQQREKLNSDNEKMAYVWAVSTALSLGNLNNEGRIVRYEDLYNNPYGETRSILDHLGHRDKLLHPAYIFEPSMTTLRTFHNSGEDVVPTTPDIFWQDRIPTTAAKHLIDTIRETMSIINFSNAALDIYLD